MLQHCPLAIWQLLICLKDQGQLSKGDQELLEALKNPYELFGARSREAPTGPYGEQEPPESLWSPS